MDVSGEYLEIQKESKLVLYAEKLMFRILNGHSAEENAYIQKKFEEEKAKN